MVLSFWVTTELCEVLLVVFLTVVLLSDISFSDQLLGIQELLQASVFPLRVILTSPADTQYRI